ncbi:MAG: hypothetical protein KA116_09540 [Proteobacteria bacterium]|nr:hypothetical protein [Pseudomonadota bacterium]
MRIAIFYFMIIGALQAAPDKKKSKTQEVIEVKTLNKQKYATLNRLVLKNDKVLFNGTELSYRVYPYVNESIAVLRKLVNDPIPELGCVAGTYTHTLKKADKQIKVSGCMESARSGQLNLSLKRLEQGLRMSVLP